MDTFEMIHPFVFAHEGGYCNNPGDPGGPTKYGVSLRWLHGVGLDVTGDGKIDAADIKALTPEHAKSLFRRYFWEYLRLDDLPPKTAMVMYDTAVNVGCKQAVLFLQRACNSMIPANLEEDGILGQRTRLTVREMADLIGRDTAIARVIVNLREAFYRKLASRPATAKADYARFLKGWMARTRDLRQVAGI